MEDKILKAADDIVSIFGETTEWLDPKRASVVKILKELLEQSINSTRTTITPFVIHAVNTDGSHHKQWYLEAIAEVLQISLPPHDNGIAP